MNVGTLFPNEFVGFGRLRMNNDRNVWWHITFLLGTVKDNVVTTAKYSPRVYNTRPSLNDFPDLLSSWSEHVSVTEPFTRYIVTNCGSFTGTLLSMDFLGWLWRFLRRFNGFHRTTPHSVGYLRVTKVFLRLSLEQKSFGTIPRTLSSP